MQKGPSSAKKRYGTMVINTESDVTERSQNSPERKRKNYASRESPSKLRSTRLDTQFERRRDASTALRHKADIAFSVDKLG